MYTASTSTVVRAYPVFLLVTDVYAFVSYRVENHRSCNFFWEENDEKKDAKRKTAIVHDSVVVHLAFLFLRRSKANGVQGLFVL